MPMTLRPYQAEAKDAILQEWSEGRKRTLLVLPTGCGKTVVLAKVAEDQVERGGRVLIMAHREELLTMVRERTKEYLGGYLRSANALDLEKTIVRPELFPLSGLYGAYILAKNALEET